MLQKPTLTKKPTFKKVAKTHIDKKPTFKILQKPTLTKHPPIKNFKHLPALAGDAQVVKNDNVPGDAIAQLADL